MFKEHSNAEADATTPDDVQLTITSEMETRTAIQGIIAQYGLGAVFKEVERLTRDSDDLLLDNIRELDSMIKDSTLTVEVKGQKLNFVIKMIQTAGTWCRTHETEMWKIFTTGFSSRANEKWIEYGFDKLVLHSYAKHADTASEDGSFNFAAAARANTHTPPRSQGQRGANNTPPKSSSGPKGATPQGPPQNSRQTPPRSRPPSQKVTFDLPSGSKFPQPAALLPM